MFRGLWAILKKEIIHIQRDPATRFIFAIPLIELLIFGYAIETDVKNVPTVVFDLNRAAESRQLVQEFANTRYFKILGEVHSDQELQSAIVSGRAKVGIKIPPDYSADLVNGRQAQVQVLIDGSDSTTALQVLNSSQQLGFLKSLAIEGISPAQFKVDVRPRLLFNPNLESVNFFVPGLIGIVLQLVTVFLTAFSIVRERERGTLEQLLVTPVSKGGLIVGKLLPYTAIGFGQTILVLLLMVFLFGVPIQGFGRSAAILVRSVSGARVRDGDRHFDLRAQPERGDAGLDHVHASFDPSIGLYLPARVHAAADLSH